MTVFRQSSRYSGALSQVTDAISTNTVITISQRLRWHSLHGGLFDDVVFNGERERPWRSWPRD
ncbi:MAG: hypothetical protein AAFN68_05075 [Pseudomonadota bacterium]